MRINEYTEGRTLQINDKYMIRLLRGNENKLVQEAHAIYILRMKLRSGQNKCFTGQIYAEKTKIRKLRKFAYIKAGRK